MWKRIALLSLVVFCCAFSGCGRRADGTEPGQSTMPPEVSGEESISTEGMNFSYTDRDLNDTWNAEDGTAIVFQDNRVLITGEGASVSGTVVTIQQEGVYVLSGTLQDGRLVVDAPKTAKIQLVFSGVQIFCSDHAPVFIKAADKVFLTLADGSENVLRDGTSYRLAEDESNVDGALFSRANLTVNGTGRLTVQANCNHGIVSKNNLVITGGEIQITAVGDGLQGKDCVKISDGYFTIQAGGDGIRSNREDDETKGYIFFSGGVFSVTAQQDGIQAATVLRVENADITLQTGGGSANASSHSDGSMRPGWGGWGGGGVSQSDEISAKGLKAGTGIQILSGSFVIDSSDDSIHSNGDVGIQAGDFFLASGDDGIHADALVSIQGGNLEIRKSYEGIEGNRIKISGGSISLTASDDGINAAGGNDGSSVNGRPGQNSFQSESTSYCRISGGYILVNASGDGIDVNGSLYITGGTILVCGPASDGDGSLDYDRTAEISGGILICTGSAGMAQTFSSSSSQNSIMYTFSSAQSGQDLVCLTDEDGTVLASFLPGKNYRNLIVSSPALEQGSTYRIIIGGSIAEMDENGFSSGGQLAGGSQITEITISSRSTVAGSSGGGGMRPGGGGRW